MTMALQEEQKALEQLYRLPLRVQDAHPIAYALGRRELSEAAGESFYQTDRVGPSEWAENNYYRLPGRVRTAGS